MAAQYRIFWSSVVLPQAGAPSTTTCENSALPVSSTVAPSFVEDPSSPARPKPPVEPESERSASVVLERRSKSWLSSALSLSSFSLRRLNRSATVRRRTV